MSIRKIASHYILNPDGSIGKFPVVTFSEKGELLSVQVNSEKLVEQPLLEFYGGLLIPGLIDNFVEFGTTDSHSAEKCLNRHFASGTLMMRCSENFFPLRKKYPVLYHSSSNVICDTPLAAEAELPLFERIKNTLLNNTKYTLPELLYAATVLSAKSAGFSHIAGSFIPSLYPALLVVENINHVKMELTAASKLRWLVI